MRNTICVGVAALALSSGAIAQDLPGHWKFSSEIDDSQFGYTDVHIDATGRVSASTLFSNGSRIDGDHFVARVVIFAEDDTPILGMQYGAGINATGGFGSANEERVGQEAAIGPELLDLVSGVGVSHHNRDTVDDAAFWEKVGDIARALWQAYQARDGEGVGLVTGMPIEFRGMSDGISMDIDTVPDVGAIPRAKRIEVPLATSSEPSSENRQRFFEERICLNPTCSRSVIR